MTQQLTFEVTEPEPENNDRGALVSPCGRYRWLLWRRWAGDARPLVWVMLNPSTAGANDDDPTIRKCRGFSRRLGYGAMSVVNLFSYRATQPSDLHAWARDGALSGEDAEQLRGACGGRDVILAWGAHGAQYPVRVRTTIEAVRGVARRVGHLGELTKAGEYRHPLMLSYATTITWWPGEPSLEAGRLV